MKKIIVIFLMLLTGFQGFAQNSELGAMAGASFYLGDLNPRTPFGMSKPAGGIIYRYNFTPRWAIRANVLFAQVEGDDAITNKHYERNLSFKSPITEIGVMAELNFFKLYHERGKNFFTPYLFDGIAVFSFNPQAQDVDGTWYALQHLGTEGQGFEGQKDYYSLCNVAIPFGLGFRFTFGKFFSLGAEWGMRFTFTDYLDDVSGEYYDNQELKDHRGSVVARLADKSENIHTAGAGRGNSTTKDFYSFAGVVFTVRFGDMDRSCDIRTNVKRKAVNGRQ